MAYQLELVSTTPARPWHEAGRPPLAAPTGDTLELTGERFQTIDGFGGCFNELGWDALSRIGQKARDEILDELFDPVRGCRFNFCRLPVGANDYSLDWYSYDEYDGDFGMEHFSIERDRRYLLPYIKAALARNRDIRLFASPWSPPVWMKHPHIYNGGSLIWKKAYLEAYALYFLKFVKAYAQEGVHIAQIHVQNEPISSQRFPSCLWSGEQFREFIRDYLGPLFEREGVGTEIWLGTINGPEVDSRFLNSGFDQYANLVLSDEAARRYISGVSYQWCGKYGIQQTYLSYPELKYLQSESECGDGSNTWEYARYIFNLCRHYFLNGAGGYIYWNMVLAPGGMSTWGWAQNSMITVDPETGLVRRNPEFYIMKHFSHFVDKGAVRLGIRGHWAGSAAAFENPGGELVVVVCNGLERERTMTLRHEGKDYALPLEPLSVNTITLRRG